ncbi:MAG: class II aldolase/adducin family protein [Candidatus Hodarchaeales archaeon]|jgi:L-fuculose-phosphate aldolase
MTDQDRKLALCFTMKELYAEKILTDIGGNLSFRSVEEPDKYFWITPSGMKKDLVEPEHLIKMTMEGEEVNPDNELSPSVEWPIHLRIYQEDDDFQFVVHSHAPLATAYSILAEPPKIPPLTAELGFLVPEIVIVPYQQSGSTELGVAVAESLWDCQTLVLENHGVVAVSEDSFQNAAIKTRALEEYLQLYLNIGKFGGKIRPFPGFD